MKAIVLACLIVTSPAWAQSKRYPPVAPDKDLEEEKHSDLWESALHPDKSPYNELVRDAQRLIERSAVPGPDDIKVALEKLDAAIKRVPKQSDAFLVRGRLHLKLKQWAKCADDLGRAEDYAKTDEPQARAQTRLELGICQARAGRHADAERTLVRAAAMAQPPSGELLLRLGEVRIALGKLDEAIDSLTAASDTSNDIARWLLAMAYDRARRPSEAQEAAQRAKSFDQSLYLIQQPRQPLLGAGDAEYLFGIAYRYAMPKPEYALLYFRRYLRVAPDSAWKKRAEEHVRELGALKLPARETITNSGSIAIDVEKVRASLVKHMPQLRACVAKLPASAFEITSTTNGPRTPETVRDRPIYRLPPPGTRVKLSLNLDSPSKDEIDRAQQCLDALAPKLPLPKPKEKDSYATMTFLVVSP